MKTRSSSGVGQKIDLSFDVETLRIFDDGDSSGYVATAQSASTILNRIKTSSAVSNATSDDEGYAPQKKVVANVQSTALNAMLNQIKTQK
jgi:hypothetical protein